MEFEYTGFLYVDPYYLDEMCRLCEEQGLSPCAAAEQVARRWDDYAYYSFEYAEGKIIEEIEKRILKKD